MAEFKEIPLSEIEPNKGQISGLPANPRLITGDKLRKLKADIEKYPEMLELRGLLVYPYEGQYVLIGGNMRARAMQELGMKTAPCIVIPESTDVERLKAYTVLDNSGFGQWDFDMLANEWDEKQLTEWGVDLPVFEPYEEDEEEPIVSDEEESDEEEIEDEDFYETMVNDVLYESDNEFEIPCLLLEMQAGKVELPLNPWGAYSRRRSDVTTYHFYVDDYRFEKLWKDPTALINSGCKAIVEPNCSTHDQTPIAYGLQLIYKKRWLARYMQDLGVKVYVDLNVAPKFREYNKMGVPKGYNAFFTRGCIGWEPSLNLDLQTAREISGKEHPNLIVYGGGKTIKEWCMKNSVLYIQDYINDKNDKKDGKGK